MKKLVPLAVLTVALAAGCASNPSGPARADEDGWLVSSGGLTLYVYDKDVANSGKSACVGDCAADWKPYAVTGSSYAPAEYTIITWPDGTRQWAYKGRPLYMSPRDTDPGDRMGQGDGWSTLKP